MVEKPLTQEHEHHLPIYLCGSTKIRTLGISHWSPFLTRTW